jgi:hypothetical protein
MQKSMQRHLEKCFTFLILFLSFKIYSKRHLGKVKTIVCNNLIFLFNKVHTETSKEMFKTSNFILISKKYSKRHLEKEKSIFLTFFIFFSKNNLSGI